MAARPRHPSKEIEAAVRYAEAKGWTCVPARGHAWARLYCPHLDCDGCIIGVWSTPRSRGDHAKDLKRYIDRCPHAEKNSEI